MKKIIILIFTLVFIFTLNGCSSAPKTFEIVGATKLIIISGDTGDSISITNSDEIKYITDNITSLKYSKCNKVNSDGWSYSLQWFDKNDQNIETLTLLGDGYTIIYDGFYYKGMSIDYEIDLTFLNSKFSK